MHTLECDEKVYVEPKPADVKPDLFGFGKDPEECNCPMPGGAHTLDCVSFDKFRENVKRLGVTAENVRGGVDNVIAEIAKRKAFQQLDSAIKAQNPARKVTSYSKVKQRIRKTFRVLRHDPDGLMSGELEPWASIDVNQLQAELQFAYRLIALLVDRTPSHGTVLSPGEVRLLIGKQPMMLDLIMNFGKTTDRGTKLGLATEILPPDPDPDITA